MATKSKTSPTPPELVAISDFDDVADLVTGLADCIFGLGVALDRAGIVTREGIADALSEIIEQQAARPDAHAPARRYAPKYLHALFRANVIDRVS